MICNKCNNQISDESNFCPNCGTKIQKEFQDVESASKSSPGINPLFIIGFAAILAIFAVYLILDSNAPTHTNDMANNDGESNQKIAQLKQQIQKEIDNPKLYIELGNSLFDIQQYNEAIPNYKKALELQPDNVEVRIDLAVSYYNSQKVDQGLQEIEKALMKEPNHEQGLFNYGVMQYNSGNIEEAKQSWNKLIEFHKGSMVAEKAKQLLDNI